MALDPPRVHIEVYSGQAVHSLGLCILYLHTDIKIFPTIFKVTDTAGSIILGRRHEGNGIHQFPKIQAATQIHHKNQYIKRDTHTQSTNTAEQCKKYCKQNMHTSASWGHAHETSETKQYSTGSTTNQMG